MALAMRRRNHLFSVSLLTAIVFCVILTCGNIFVLDNDTTYCKVNKNRGIKNRTVSHLSVLFQKDIQLPATALEGELRLRKLMQRTDNDYNSLRWIRYSHTKSVHLTHVSSVELSRVLSRGSSCHDIAVNISDETSHISSGWTKAVYRGKFKNTESAIKMVNINGNDVNKCRVEGSSMDICRQRAQKKLLREIAILMGLDHHNIVKVLGYCVPDHNESITMATELGHNIDLISLLQMSWEDRLRICYDVTKLINYLSHSPHGSVILNDFRREQFVLVNGELKLTDVDDVGFGDPPCDHNVDCVLRNTDINVTLRTKCTAGRCKYFNEKVNILNAAQHFTSFLLQAGAPPSLKPVINKFVDDSNNARYRIGDLERQLGNIVQAYSKGEYLSDKERTHSTEYNIYQSSDLPVGDYRCAYAITASTCTLSVYAIREAKELCDFEPQCIAFVFTNRKTWTGRTIIHLKNEVSILSNNTNTTLYIKKYHDT